MCNVLGAQIPEIEAVNIINDVSFQTAINLKIRAVRNTTLSRQDLNNPDAFFGNGIIFNNDCVHIYFNYFGIKDELTIRALRIDCRNLSNIIALNNPVERDEHGIPRYTFYDLKKMPERMIKTDTIKWAKFVSGLKLLDSEDKTPSLSATRFEVEHFSSEGSIRIGGSLSVASPGLKRFIKLTDSLSTSKH